VAVGHPTVASSTLNPIKQLTIATELGLLDAHALKRAGYRPDSDRYKALYLAVAIAQPTDGKLAEPFGPRRRTGGGILASTLGGIHRWCRARHSKRWPLRRLLMAIGTSAGYPTAMMVMIIRPPAQSGAGLTAPPAAVLARLSIASKVTIAAAHTNRWCDRDFLAGARRSWSTFHITS